MNAYNGGINLTGLDGTPCAGIDVRADGSSTDLTVTLQTDRGCMTSVISLFQVSEVFELSGALRAAAERMRECQIAAGGPV